MMKFNKKEVMILCQLVDKERVKIIKNQTSKRVTDVHISLIDLDNLLDKLEIPC